MERDANGKITRFDPKDRIILDGSEFCLEAGSAYYLNMGLNGLPNPASRSERAGKNLIVTLRNVGNNYTNRATFTVRRVLEETCAIDKPQ